MGEDHDPMELAEIDDLQWQIRLLQDRLMASADGQLPLSEQQQLDLCTRLGKLQEQLVRVESPHSL